MSQKTMRAAGALGVGGAVLATILTPATAIAQAAGAAAAGPERTEEPEAVVITGSRIAQRKLDSASPVAVVGSEEFQLSGAVNVEQVLNTLPQVVPGVTAFSNNPGNGAATLDLRGLGNQRTLVLVNDRRYIFFDPTQTVDLNTIPQFLIESVDVVTGGASAVYGSDAIAGVVNFRLRNDLQGLTVGSQYALTQRGDGARWNANIALGSDILDGAGHITLYGEYFNRKAISQANRAFSRQVMVENADDSALVPGGNTTTPQGRFAIASEIVVPGGNGLGSVTLSRGVGNFATSLGSFYTAPGVSRPFNSANDSYNFYPDNFLQLPQERWLVGGYGHYEISPALNPYFEVTFANNRVQSQLAPTPVTGNFAVATNNPFLSAADRASLVQTDINEAAIDAARVARSLAPQFNDPGFVNVSVFRRMNDIAERSSLFERNAWRAVVGTKGELGEGLRYDAYYLFSRTRNGVTQEGNISRSKFAAALRANRLNVFGPNTISEALGQEISITAQNTQISQLQVASASLSGNLFELGLGGDALGFAAGVEWRDVASEFIPDTALASGDVIGFNAGQPTKGSYSVKEAFAELLVPVIADKPFIKEFTLRGAARYGDYSLAGVGGVFTWAAGAEWAPVSDIRFRGQFQKATRAPNVGELYGGRANGFPSADDPCSSRSAASSRTDAVRALCIATGVPSALVFQTSIQPNSQVESAVGGNPLLREERSETYTAGIVVRPRFVPGLSITADYFDIKVDDYVAALGGGTQGILDLCYYTVQDANSDYCKAIARDPSTGQIGGQFLVSALNANISTLRTAGIDLQLDYSRRIGAGILDENARINLSFLGTWTTRADYTPVADLPGEVRRCDGSFGSACDPVFGDPVPKFRFTSRLSLVDGPLTASLRYRHIGKVTNDAILNGTSDASSITVDRLGSKGYTDLAFAVRVDSNLEMTFGINNLLDIAPTIIDDSNDEQGGTYPSTYDVLGRDFFISARLKF